jgi:hypothetical protein
VALTVVDRLHHDLRVDLSLEPGLGDGDAVSADGQVRSLVQTVVLAQNVDFKVGGKVMSFDGSVPDGGSAGVGDCPEDGPEQSLGVQRGEGGKGE